MELPEQIREKLDTGRAIFVEPRRLFEDDYPELYIYRNSEWLDQSAVVRIFPEDKKDRLRREIEVFGRLKHIGYVVDVIDYVTKPDLFYLVMENVEGGSLSNYIRDRHSSTGMIRRDEILPLMTHLCRGLQEIHGAGVLHRDIKPSNILLSKNGIPKYADFHISVVLNGARPCTETVGSPGYMAPEVLDGEYELHPRIDLYSLGCVLYFMLTGESPPDPKGFVDLILGRSDIDGRFREILKNVLAYDPGARIASAKELLSRIEGIDWSRGDSRPFSSSSSRTGSRGVSSSFPQFSRGDSRPPSPPVDDEKTVELGDRFRRKRGRRRPGPGRPPPRPPKAPPSFSVTPLRPLTGIKGDPLGPPCVDGESMHVVTRDGGVSTVYLNNNKRSINRRIAPDVFDSRKVRPPFVLQGGKLYLVQEDKVAVFSTSNGFTKPCPVQPRGAVLSVVESGGSIWLLEGPDTLCCLDLSPSQVRETARIPLEGGRFGGLVECGGMIAAYGRGGVLLVDSENGMQRQVTTSVAASAVALTASHIAAVVKPTRRNRMLTVYLFEMEASVDSPLCSASIACGSLAGGPFLWRDHSVFVDNKGAVYALDSRTGDILEVFQCESGVTGRPVLFEDFLLVPCFSKPQIHLEIVQLSETPSLQGKCLRKQDIPLVDSMIAPVEVGRTVYYPTCQGDVIGFMFGERTQPA